MYFLNDGGGGIADTAGAGSGMPGWEFWAGVVALITAVVMTAGPAIARRIAPPDKTVSEMAKSSGTAIENALSSTLEMVRGDLAHVRAKTEDNGKKLDDLLARRVR